MIVVQIRTLTSKISAPAPVDTDPFINATLKTLDLVQLFIDLFEGNMFNPVQNPVPSFI